MAAKREASSWTEANNAQTGSLSAAANLAHLSLSGASHKLNSLEESLGTKLFERHRRGLRSTRGGQVVASNGRLMLALLDHLVINVVSGDTLDTHSC